MPPGAVIFLSLFAPFDQLGWIGLTALLGAYSGGYVFLRGFRMLRHKRLILNTPFSKIRSASMGLVEVSGMAEGPQTILAGITGEPCFYYRARAWLQSDSGNRGNWEQVADETVFVPFFVNDGTGRMLVYPQGAHLDVHRNFREEYGGSLFASRELIPESVRRFIQRHGISTSGMIRLEEQCILPGYPLFVFGTLGENPEKSRWVSPSHAGGLPPSSSPYDSENAPMPVRATPVNPGRTAKYAGTSVQVADSAETRRSGGDDAEKFDLRARGAITKGERGQFFTISSQSQREVAFSLEWQAIACIWGGPALALLSLYVLIVSWSWS